MRAVQTKKCGTVTSITIFYDKLLENMKTAKKAKFLAKERSLPDKKKQKTKSLDDAFLIKPRNALRPTIRDKCS